jgi:hypothetical protein
MMSIVWPVFWFGLILSAIISTVVVALMDQSKRKKALKAIENRQRKLQEQNNLGESMESIDSFPAEESFEFSDFGNK